MKYLIYIAVFLSCSAQASKNRCPIATPANAIGVWQAYSTKSGALYELRFNKDGSSSLTASTLYGNVWIGTSKEVVVNNSGLSIGYANIEDKTERVVVNGFGVSCEENGRLSLVIDSQFAGHIFNYQNLDFSKGNLVDRLTKIQGKIDGAK